MHIQYHVGDLFALAPRAAPLAHCVSADLRMGRGIATEFKKRFGQVDELRAQKPEVGNALRIVHDERPLYYLVTKQAYHHKPTVASFTTALEALHQKMEAEGDAVLWIPKIGCGLDRLDWDRDVLPVLTRVFDQWEGEIHVCSLN